MRPVHVTFAYVDVDKQVFTKLPEGITHKYRLSEENFELTSGYYKIEYVIWEAEDQAYDTTIYYINTAEPRTPMSLGMLRGLLKQITAYSDRICDRFSRDEEISSILERITNESWLQEIKGIGKKTAPKLAAKFQQFTPGELKVFSVFTQHGIPYSRGTKREAWACAYFKLYPEELEAFQKNPYKLYFITDTNSPRVSRLQKLQPSLTPVSYSLQAIDEAALEQSDVWAYSVERAAAYLADIVACVFDNGHTVASAEQVLYEMQEAGFESVVDDGQEYYLNATGIEHLATKTPSVVRGQYADPISGESVKGFTTQDAKQKSDLIYQTTKRLLEAKRPYGEEGEKRLIDTALTYHPFELDLTQNVAIQYAFSNTISAVTGAAGTGKTTTIQAILNGAARLLFSRESRIAAGSPKTKLYTAVNLYVTAPTGKATDRVREGLKLQHPYFNHEKITPEQYSAATIEETRFQDQGSFHVCTLHSFLGYKGSHFELPKPHPAFIVVDEASMCDLEVMWALMVFVDSCLQKNIPVQILLTGDVEQLPPVGAGYPYRDLLGRKVDGIIPSTTLNEIHRQGQCSAIIWGAQRILDGKLPPGGNEVKELETIQTDFYWHDYPHVDFEMHEYAEAVARRAEKYTDGPPVCAEDVHLMLALRNPSTVEPEAFYVRKENKKLQEHFANERGAELQRFVAYPDEEASRAYVIRFAEGDKVVHAGRNNYKGHEAAVMKGNAGRIVSIEDGEVTVQYDTTAATYKSPAEIAQLSLSYVSTVHWSQGSEYAVTGIIVPRMGAPTLVTRPWLYTAITRASRFSDIMATPERMQNAAAFDATHARQTLLSIRN